MGMTGVIRQEKIGELEPSDEFKELFGSTQRDFLPHDCSVNVKKYAGEVIMVLLKPGQEADRVFHIFLNVSFAMF
jgi:hypothetical protein